MASRAGRILLACVIATVIGVGTAGVAHAEIVDPPGYTHLRNWESEQCLMAEGEGLFVQQWRCLNADSEIWRIVTVGGHFLLANRWTKLCMALPEVPVDNTPVVQRTCNENDALQLWDSYEVASGHGLSARHIVGVLGGLCMEAPDENSGQGVQMRMKHCADQESWNPFHDRHYEQFWSFI